MYIIRGSYTGQYRRQDITALFSGSNTFSNGNGNYGSGGGGGGNYGGDSGKYTSGVDVKRTSGTSGDVDELLLGSSSAESTVASKKKKKRKLKSKAKDERLQHPVSSLLAPTAIIIDGAPKTPSGLAYLHLSAGAEV